jgi:hypothetical protein
MCRPSCCKPSHEGTGIAAVAVVAGAAVAIAKIGPVLARIWHIAIEALTIFTLTCAAAAACILLTWATVRLIGMRRKPPSGVSRPGQPETDAQPIAQPRRQLAAAQAHAGQADALIGYRITPHVPAAPLRREPRELSPHDARQGGRDGRP